MYNREEALQQLLALVPEGHSFSWGGSATLQSLGAVEALTQAGRRAMDRAEVPFTEWIVCDSYLMSTNALTEDGILYNIDGRANRLVALLYGPGQVIIVSGMNKLVKCREDAYSRARNYAAPINAQRFELATPCKQTGSCADCLSEQSICCQLLETRLCRPAGRIKLILIGEDLGF